MCITGDITNTNDLVISSSTYPGPKKRGFSCPAGRVRLAAGRVQTAEWTC